MTFELISITNEQESTPVLLPPEIYRTVVELTPLVSIDLIVRDRRGRVLVGYRRNRPARVLGGLRLSARGGRLHAGRVP